MNDRNLEHLLSEIGRAAIPSDIQKSANEATAHFMQSLSSEPKSGVWRKIVKSRISRLSAAAAIILFLLSVTSYFFSGEKLQAAELLEKVAQNMENRAWVKSIKKIYKPGNSEAVSTDIDWIDTKNNRRYTVFEDKRIQLWDHIQKEGYDYNPETKEMTIWPLVAPWVSPADNIHKFIAKLRKMGLDVKQSTGLYKNRYAIILEYKTVQSTFDDHQSQTVMLMNEKHVRTILFKAYVTKDDLQLYATETSYFDIKGDIIVVEKSESKVMDDGPQDIFDLGVPKEVTIINKISEPKVQEIYENMDNHRKQFLESYVAVIIDSRLDKGKERISRGVVVVRHGEKLRVDVYRPPYETPDPYTIRFKDELRFSLVQIKKFWQDDETRGIRSVILHDGIRHHIVDMRKDKVIARVPQLSLNQPSWGWSRRNIEDLAWKKLQWLFAPNRMIEDDYSRKNGFLAMELTAQRRGFKLPNRQVLYVDPKKDYNFQRYIEEELLDAPWQKDKKWLDTVEKKDQLYESSSVWNVVEYDQTSTGRWYPKVIEIEGYMKGYTRDKWDNNRILRIHLITENPDPMPDLFDPDNLPKPKE